MASEPFLATIFMFAGNFAPRGYAFCQGQLLPIAQYSALFSLLGTTYGGDGRTTFALPDLRGRVAQGTGQGPGLSAIALGQQGGSQNVTLTAAQMPSHNHGATVTIHAANDGRPSIDNPSGAVLDSTSGTNLYAVGPDGTTMNAGMATAQIANAGGNQPVSILDPFLGINFIIALEGIFPSRS
jgi:microcystin-dependent protein